MARHEALAARRVMVTGATGFIGVRTVEALLGAGAHVTAVAAVPDKRPLRRPVGGGQLTVRQLDLLAETTSSAELRRALHGVEDVVHLDYRPPAVGSNPLDHERSINVAGLRRLLAALPDSVHHVAFASSVSVYGPGVPNPVPETTSVRPTTPYGQAKVEAEELLDDWARSTRSTASALRFATVYGRGETVARAVPNFVRAALSGQAPVVNGTGASTRDYVHVSDVARGIVQALLRDDGQPDTFNLGSGIGRTTRQVAELVVRLAGGTEAPVHRPGGGPADDLVCDLAHARRRLGYEPLVDFTEGVEDEVAWFAARPELVKRRVPNASP